MANQLIVSDDSDDEIAQLNAALCARQSNVVYTRGPRRGLSANRNHSLRQLSRDVEWVAFIDDDVIMSPDYLSQASQALASSTGRTIVTGSEIQNGALVSPRNSSFWGYQEIAPTNSNDFRTIVINSAIFPMRLFDEIEFDENLWYGHEEVDICGQAIARGYVIRFVPELVNEHCPSRINREEYDRFLETSRLYATFKRHWLLERRKWTAIAFALLGPTRLIASSLRRSGLRGLVQSIRSIVAAFELLFKRQAWAPVPAKESQLLGVDARGE